MPMNRSRASAPFTETEHVSTGNSYQKSKRARLFVAPRSHDLSQPMHSWSHGGAINVERKLDTGLWLLGGAYSRQCGWLRLTNERANRAETREAKFSAYSVAKRIIDVAVASVLLVVAAPLMLVAAVLIRLDSPGPALFYQRRVGHKGSHFLLWKFRSMYVDSPIYATSPKSDCDSRITRFGRVLRRASIDELPQLINVFKGEMSLVGPRPEMPFIVEDYTLQQRERLTVKPGITGLWQISPARAHPIHENIDYDLHYIRHRNLRLDGAILLGTLSAVVRGVGAV